MFSRQAPLEAVAAVTQTLPQLLGDHLHSARIPITDMPLDQLAALNGWSVDNGARTLPDLCCRLKHAPGKEIAWQVEHLYYENAPLATFTRDAPESLVRNFFAHLASPMAVERAVANVPLSTRYEDSTRITPVRGTAMNLHIEHALAQLDCPGRHR